MCVSIVPPLAKTPVVFVESRMPNFVRCFVCNRRAVSFIPIPLCKLHEDLPQAPVAMQDSDEEILFEDLDAEGYTLYNYDDEFPVYPI